MKVYIPTMEELEQLQKFGVNVYGYLITKVTETIIMEDKVYDSGDMFEILSYLGPHPEIMYSICRMYPQKIKESIIASKDKELCKKLLTSILKEDKTIYQLDDILMNFDEAILFDEEIIKNVVNFISTHIHQSPKYRFEYLGPNDLLDKLFSCELPQEKITMDSYQGLITIDPIYSLKLETLTQSENAKIINEMVQRGASMHMHRYGIFDNSLKDYGNKDIINKPDENVKRLIKCLEYHKQTYQ